jgi:putative membrane protein
MNHLGYSLVIGWLMFAFATTEVTDRQIAKVLEMANKAEMDTAKLAKFKTKSAAVDDLAKHMLNDHKKNNSETLALCKKLKLMPEKSELSKEIEKTAAQNMLSLRQMKGADFDRAYVAEQIAMHQKLVDNIDQVLLPGAQNPELKKLLEKTRPTVVAHIAHAKNVQAQINK